jgi:hypothetical protein
MSVSNGRLVSLTTITQGFLAAFTCAIGAAKHFAAAFHAVTDDAAAAMIALRRHDVNRAFETVEDECFAVTFNLKRFVVVISTMCTFSHEVVSGSGFHLDI